MGETYSTILTFDEDADTVIEVAYNQSNEKKVHEILNKVFQPYTVKGIVSTRFLSHIAGDLLSSKIFETVKVLRLENNAFIEKQVVQ